MASQDSRVTDVYHEAIKFDLFPLMPVSSLPLAESASREDADLQFNVQLGKRARSEGQAYPPAHSDEGWDKARSLSGSSGMDPAAYLTQYLL